MMNNNVFQDRKQAGQHLAKELTPYKSRQDVIVLGLPRGGIPVAYEVAKALKAPLDIFTVRKLGVPGHEEMAMGAIATGDARYINQDVVQMLNIDDHVIDKVEEKERRELQRREALYRGERPRPDLSHKTVILVDDGLATGATMQAAVEALQQHQPAKIVVAVPVASQEACQKFEQMVDEVVCVLTPQHFRAVGLWYRNFGQTSDNEVRYLLQEARNNERIPDSIA